MGLKRGLSFSAEGIFDLIVPTSTRAAYGIRFTDRLQLSPNPGPPTAANQVGDDIMQLVVVKRTDGNVYVQFSEHDFVNSTVTLIEQVLLSIPIGATSIRLRLNHTADGSSTADTGKVDAAFDYLDAGRNVVGSGSFTNTGQIFGQETVGSGDDENWTLAQFVGFTADPVPEPASLALLGLGLAALGFARRRRAG